MKIYKYKWKDSAGNYWTLTATDSGERQKIQGIHFDDDDGDVEWIYEIFVDCGSSEPPISIHKGLFVGQQDQPPKLHLLLQDYLSGAVAIVVDGIRSAQEVE